MKIAIIGTGYVGLPTGVGLAELGHQVVCIDRELSKIEKLRQGVVTLYEDGLAELLTKNMASGNISFTTSMADGVKDAAVVIIAVGTPPHPVTHEADLRYIYAAACELAPLLDHYTVVANKSTVPVGTGDMVENLIVKTNHQAQCDVISLPEFLREGFAVHDFFCPDRIIIGANSERASKVIMDMYRPLLERNTDNAGKCATTVLLVSRRSSETIKYAANSFLATKIHFINEMADFCEKTGADIGEVAQGMGLDRRIGDSFLTPGPGFGGSCFPKDTMALDFMARQNNVELKLVRATIEGNRSRMEKMADTIISSLEHIEHPVVGVLGLAFKNGTDDCRVSPAMQIIEYLLCKTPKVRLKVFDPKAMDNARLIFQEKGVTDRISFCESMSDVAYDADVLAVLTEWNEFRQFDLNAAYKNMRHHQIIDCRNLFNPHQARAAGFSYKGIGVH